MINSMLQVMISLKCQYVAQEV